MKKIYFIRAAEAEDFSAGYSDYERSLDTKGIEEVKIIASYMKNHNISIDTVLSSCAMRAQETVTELENMLSPYEEKQFLEELYYQPYKGVLKIIMALDQENKTLLIVGHYPQLNELINTLSQEPVEQISHIAMFSLEFDIKEWSQLEEVKGKVKRFIS